VEYLTSIVLGLGTVILGIALIAYGVLLKPKQRPLRRIK
jgi:hypothetical protein